MEVIPLNVLQRAMNLRRSSRNYTHQVSIPVTDNDAAAHWIMGDPAPAAGRVPS